MGYVLITARDEIFFPALFTDMPPELEAQISEETSRHAPDGTLLVRADLIIPHCVHQEDLVGLRAMEIVCRRNAQKLRKNLRSFNTGGDN